MNVSPLGDTAPQARASVLESAFESVDLAAARAVDSAKAALKAANDLGKAASLGDIDRMRKAADRAYSTSQAAHVAAQEASRAWPFRTDEEVAQLRDGLEREVLKLAAALGVAVRKVDDRLSAFPCLIKLQPERRSVQVDGKRLQTARPSRVVDAIREAQVKKQKLVPERFIEVLHRAYVLCIGTRSDAETMGITLLEVYDALTLLPDARREYGLPEFGRDLYSLDHSGVGTTKEGARLALPSSTGPKSGRSISVVGPDGQSTTYYGIRFTRGR